MIRDGQLCTFRLDGTAYGIDIERVLEVVRRPPITRVPLAPPPVCGLINLRGQIVPVVEPRLCLGLAGAGGEGGFVIVVRGAEEPVGLLVDEIGDVLDVDPAAFEPAPATVSRAGGEAVRGVHKQEDALLVSLDLERVLERAWTPAGEGVSNEGGRIAPAGQQSVQNHGARAPRQGSER